MHARAELDNRLMHCYEKFTKQDIVWLVSILLMFLGIYVLSLNCILNKLIALHM